jgi:hypothetical protein
MGGWAVREATMEQQVPELERAKRLIRKLSERTSDRGFTETEALEAAEKMGALLQQFDLELSDVFIAEEICKQIEIYSDDSTAYGVVGGIARLCSLRHYHVTGSSPATYVLFGFERDIELATYLWEVLTEALNQGWADYSKIHGYARKKRDSYRMGFGERVRKRLLELRNERDAANAARVKASDCKDLVFVRDARVDEEFEKTGVRLVQGKSRTVHEVGAYWSGASHADTVGLHVPLNGDAQSLIQ